MDKQTTVLTSNSPGPNPSSEVVEFVDSDSTTCNNNGFYISDLSGNVMINIQY